MRRYFDSDYSPRIPAVSKPIGIGFAKWAAGQAIAGVGTELTNNAVNLYVNHIPAPQVWEAVAFGAGAGFFGGLIGQGIGRYVPGAGGMLLGGGVTGLGTGILGGGFGRMGIYFRMNLL